MPEDPAKTKSFIDDVELREKRKVRARRKKSDQAWFGLGLSGVVGWSIAIPTIVGIFAGVWIDLRWPGLPSWTLMLMIIGIIVGCVNAWLWVSRQRRMINQERKNDVE